MAGVMCWTLLSTLAMYHAHAASTTTTTSSTSSSSSRSSTNSILRHSSSSPAYTGPAPSTPLSLRTSSSYIVYSGPTSSTPLSLRTSSSYIVYSGPTSSTPLSLRTSSSYIVYTSPAAFTPLSRRTSSSYIVSSGPAPSNPLSLRTSSSYIVYSGPTSSNTLSLRTSSSYIVYSGPTSSNTLSLRTSSSYIVPSGPSPSTPLSLITSSSSSASSGETPSNFPNLKTPSSYIVLSGPAPSSPPNISSAYRAQAEKRRGRRRRRSSAYSNSPNTITSPSSSVYTGLTPSSTTNPTTSPSNTSVPSNTTRSDSPNQRPSTSNNALSGTNPPTPPNLKPSSSRSTTPPGKPQSSGGETEGPGAAGGPSCSLEIPAQALRVGLGCVGGLLNTVAMYCVWKHRELTGPFRAVLASLTLSGQAMAVVCVLLAVCSLAQTYSYPGWVTGTRRQKDWDWEPSSLSVVCSVGISLYHSLLGCGATTTLALSIDRVLAVFLPVRYRVLGLTGSRMSMIIVSPWMLALVSVVALPFLWHFYGDGEIVELNAMSCWPLVATHSNFLIFQSVVLLVSAVGVTVTHVVTLHKLSRRAILVLPIFGPRTADTTSGERRQIRRNTAHGAFQALMFCCLYLPFAAYMMVLGSATGNRTLEACSVRFVSVSLFPVVNTIVNPLLTLARLGNKGPSGAGAVSSGERAAAVAGATAKVCGSESQEPAVSGDPPTQTRGDLFLVAPDMTSRSPERDGKGKGKGKGSGRVGFQRSRLNLVKEEVKAVDGQAEARVEGEGEGEDQVDSHPSCSYTHHVSVSSGSGACRRSVQRSENDSSAAWSAPRDNYGQDECRADPLLLKRALI